MYRNNLSILSYYFFIDVITFFIDVIKIHFAVKALKSFIRAILLSDVPSHISFRKEIRTETMSQDVSLFQIQAANKTRAFTRSTATASQLRVFRTGYGQCWFSHNFGSGHYGHVGPTRGSVRMGRRHDALPSEHSRIENIEIERDLTGYSHRLQ